MFDFLSSQRRQNSSFTLALWRGSFLSSAPIRVRPSDIYCMCGIDPAENTPVGADQRLSSILLLSPLDSSGPRTSHSCALPYLVKMLRLWGVSEEAARSLSGERGRNDCERSAQPHVFFIVFHQFLTFGGGGTAGTGESPNHNRKAHWDAPHIICDTRRRKKKTSTRKTAL